MDAWGRECVLGECGYVRHPPSGLKYDFNTHTGMPHLWAIGIETLSASRKIEMVTDTMKGVGHIHLGNVKKVIDADIVNQPTELKKWLARRTPTLELDRHRLQGHRHVAAECPECRHGALRGRACASAGRGCARGDGAEAAEPSAVAACTLFAKSAKSSSREVGALRFGGVFDCVGGGAGAGSCAADPLSRALRAASIIA